MCFKHTLQKPTSIMYVVLPIVLMNSKQVQLMLLTRNRKHSNWRDILERNLCFQFQTTLAELNPHHSELI